MPPAIKRSSLLQRLQAGRRQAGAVADAPATRSGGAESDSTTPSTGTRLSAAEIHENVRVAAEEEMKRPARDLAWSSLAAGLTIGFSFLAAAYLSMWVDPVFAPVAIAVGYPLGFIFVVQARNQLFTENTLEPVIPFLARRDRKTFFRVLRLWTIVLAGNLVGAFVFALLARETTLLDEPLRRALLHVATLGTSGGFAQVVYRAIFGGWLVALMAWLVSSTLATGTQVLYIWLTTAPIAAFGFRHSIAGAVEAFYLAFAGSVTWSSAIVAFLIPAIIGNIIGGVVLVAMLNHGQVGSDSPGERAPGRRSTIHT
ncbi:MAG: formate/nitrite transporter family protein [Gemmatimonadota bacterium]|nr:formate/nitrite transporter family protein [Gemmatimonadota bacterium]